jgi:hypothetical protein
VKRKKGKKKEKKRKEAYEAPTLSFLTLFGKLQAQLSLSMINPISMSS